MKCIYQQGCINAHDELCLACTNNQEGISPNRQNPVADYFDEEETFICSGCQCEEDPYEDGLCKDCYEDRYDDYEDYEDYEDE